MHKFKFRVWDRKENEMFIVKGMEFNGELKKVKVEKKISKPVQAKVNAMGEPIIDEFKTDNPRS